MRLYFDLSGPQYTLPDLYGVEVSDLEQARQVALEIIGKLRHVDSSVAQHWSGWKVSVVDEAGTVVLTVDLDSSP
jgi:hypothetical protein